LLKKSNKISPSIANSKREKNIYKAFLMYSFGSKNQNFPSPKRQASLHETFKIFLFQRVKLCFKKPSKFSCFKAPSFASKNHQNFPVPKRQALL
jgi:hypothetical protein